MTKLRKTAAGICALALSCAIMLSMCGCSDILSLLDYIEDDSQQVGQTAEIVIVSPADGITLEAMMDRLNAERWADNRLEYSMEDYLPDYNSEDFLSDEFSDSELSLLTTQPADIPPQLTYEQAVEDVEYLFRILRTSYGAYTFFGGDRVFDKAKSDVLSELYFYYPGGITVSDLRSLMLESLSFVEDTHFDIDGEGTGFLERYYYHSPDLTFRRDSMGYYNSATADGRWYLCSEDEKWLRPTIAEHGEIVYGVFALANSEEAESLPESLRIGSTEGGAGNVTLHWERIDCPYVQHDYAYRYEEIDGIPVISLNTYYLEESVFDDINNYLNDALTLRNEEVIVIDLRYNTGGYDLLSEMWLYDFTEGEFIDWGIGYSAYISRLNEYVLNSNAEEVNNIFERLDFFERHPDYWGDESDDSDDSYEYSEGDIYEIELTGGMEHNDTTIFVLCNKHTYSAGELALFQLENMENVVFVGMNSNGCLLTGGTNMDAPVWLPNSGMSVYYSTILVTSEIMEDFDANGFQPDLIVDDDDAVQDVIDCWNFYNK